MLPQGYVQFNVECDLVQYETKVETIVEIRLQNLLNKIVSELFEDHPIKTICK